MVCGQGGCAVTGQLLAPGQVGSADPPSCTYRYLHSCPVRGTHVFGTCLACKSTHAHVHAPPRQARGPSVLTLFRVGDLQHRHQPGALGASHVCSVTGEGSWSTEQVMTPGDMPGFSGTTTQPHPAQRTQAMARGKKVLGTRDYSRDPDAINWPWQAQC